MSGDGALPPGCSESDVDRAFGEEEGVTCEECGFTYGALDFEDAGGCPNCVVSIEEGEEEAWQHPAPLIPPAAPRHTWRCLHCMMSSVVEDWLEHGFRCPLCRGKGESDE